MDYSLQEPPICVDLDGTLIQADTLGISVQRLLLGKPWVLPRLLLALCRGKAAFKASVADRFVPDPTTLPYRKAVLDFLRHEYSAGRRLILTTAADRRIASAVAGHLGIFHAVISSDDHTNARGLRKLTAIQEHLGGGAFDYVGDSMADLPVLLAARNAFLVCPTLRLRRLVMARCRSVRLLT